MNRILVSLAICVFALSAVFSAEPPLSFKKILKEKYLKIS